MQDVEFAVVALAGDPSEPLELVPAQGVEPLVPRRVLHEPGLVAEPVVAILAHAVEVGLVLAVVAVRELAVLVEPAGDQGERRYLIINMRSKAEMFWKIFKGEICVGLKRPVVGWTESCERNDDERRRLLTLIHCSLLPSSAPAPVAS